MFKHLTAKEITDQLGGKIVGDTEALVTGIASLQNAKKNQITFFSDSKLAQFATACKATIVVTTLEHSEQFRSVLTKIIVDEPYFYFSQVLALMAVDTVKEGLISQTAAVGNEVVLGVGCSIGHHSVIEDFSEIGDGATIGALSFIGQSVKIGRNTVIESGARVLDGSEIGENCIIHSGAVIGADGFGYVQHSRQWKKVPQVGRVIIGNDCEVGANTTIDKGAIDDTVISARVKIDNQVQIGHNCIIGEDTIIAGCVGIAGSVGIGKNCRVGGAAMFTGHLVVCDDVDVSAGSLVSKDINVSGRYTGVYPLSEHGEWKKNAVLIRHLSDLKRRIRELEASLSNLQEK